MRMRGHEDNELPDAVVRTQPFESYVRPLASQVTASLHASGNQWHGSRHRPATATRRSHP